MGHRAPADHERALHTPALDDAHEVVERVLTAIEAPGEADG
jgi:hypothetical protein